MISLRDWVGGVVHLAEHDDASGPFNLCCPETPTNAEFTQALGRALSRPTVIPVPAFAIRLGAWRMASELLGSVNTVPQALIDAGYEFRDHDVDGRARGRARSVVVDLGHAPARRRTPEHDPPRRGSAPGKRGPRPAGDPRLGQPVGDHQ